MSGKFIKIEIPATVKSKKYGEVSLESSTYVKVLREQSLEIVGRRKESGQN
jgi:hypothetical protein